MSDVKLCGLTGLSFWKAGERMGEERRTHYYTVTQEAGRGLRVLLHYSSVPFFGEIRLLVVLVNPHLRSTWRMGDRDSD